MATERDFVFSPNKSSYQDFEKGRNYLLAIGISSYQDSAIPDLKNARRDAQKIIDVLTIQYLFEHQYVKTLFDKEATRENIIDQLDYFASIAEADDNLLFYFAGHGYFRQKGEIGYLVPSDARLGKYASLIPNSTILDYLPGINARHILLLVDSCYSGSLITQTRNISSFDREREGIETYARRVKKLRSRLGLAAGRVETVEDGIGNHSPFTNSLINILKKNPHTQLPASELFQKVKTSTTLQADQTPVSGILAKSMHEGGEFVFQLRPDENQDWLKAQTINQIPDFQSFIQSYPQSHRVEEAYWRIAMLTDTKVGFRAYTNHFPNGIYFEQALDGLEMCDQRDQFQKAKQRGEAALIRFIRKFPKGHFLKEAKIEIERIQLQEQEPLLWEKAKEGTEDALQVYLMNFPEGIYAEQARKKLTSLQAEKRRIEREQIRREDKARKQAEKEKKRAEARMIAEQKRLKLEQQQAETKRIEAERLAKVKKEAEATREAEQAFKRTLALQKKAERRLRLENRKRTVSAFFRNRATQLSSILLGVLILAGIGIQFFPNSSSPPDLPLINLKSFGLPDYQLLPVKGGMLQLDNQIHISGFMLGKVEVDQKLWQTIMGTEVDSNRFPTDTASWMDCQIFLQRLNEKTQGLRFRLPSEAEWAYAMASNSRPRKSDEQTPFPISLGFYDLSSKVEEWCHDRWHDQVSMIPLDGSAYIKGDNPNRVQRRTSQDSSTAVQRDYGKPEDRAGFRLAISINQLDQLDSMTKDPMIPNMILIPGGTFRMGSEAGQSDERPFHQVKLESFELAETEVTNAQFCVFLNDVTTGNHQLVTDEWVDFFVQFVADTLFEIRNDTFVPKSGLANHPISLVPWEGAKAYCEWLGNGFRLPTEAEWEFAAGGGKANRTTWPGTNDMDKVRAFANFEGNVHQDFFPKTAPVASFAPDKLGLYDLAGNVYEWCQDERKSNYNNVPTDGSAWNRFIDIDSLSSIKLDSIPPIPHIRRGGSWIMLNTGPEVNPVMYLRAANRAYASYFNGSPPHFSDFDTGFRLARSIYK